MVAVMMVMKQDGGGRQPWHLTRMDKLESPWKR